MSQPGPSEPRLSPAARRKNARVGLMAAGGFVVMVGAAYAAVPLYKAFCQLTGFDGSTRRAEAASDRVLDKTVTVRFDANVNGLPWTFKASQTSQQARIGETKLAFFKVTNNSDKPVTARAVYNVVPEQAGAYFQKLQCFCFEDTTVPARTTIEMPVLYFLDPKYAQDFDTRGKPEVTLSYTFFPSVPKTAEAKPAPKG